jgi:hypothetical protein
MSEAKLWFSSKSVRRILIRSYAGLVGKAPTKQKRLKILVTMPVTGQKVTGYPEWLENDITHVMKNGGVIKASQTIDYCNVTMSDEANLFQKKPVEAPKAKLSHFSIEQMGSGEDPVTVVKFQMLAPFSTDLNAWCGQQAGEEFDAQFELTEMPADGEEEDEEGDDALEGEEEDELKAQARRRKENADIAAAKKSLKLIS